MGVIKEDIERMFKAVEIVQTELVKRTALEAEQIEQTKAEQIEQFKTEVAWAKAVLEFDLMEIGWKGIRF